MLAWPILQIYWAQLLQIKEAFDNEEFFFYLLMLGIHFNQAKQTSIHAYISLLKIDVDGCIQKLLFAFTYKSKQLICKGWSLKLERVILY